MEKNWQNYIDKEGRLLSYPSNKKIREQLLCHLVQNFEEGKKYTEPEVNEILKSSLLFSDYELIRRELYQYHFIDRKRDGSFYWREERKQIEKIKHKLIMVEGLPGSGKTTTSIKIGEYLTQKLSSDTEMTVRVYQEGDLHPTDMAWCACVPMEELETIYRHYPDYREAIERNMNIEKIGGQDFALIAYTAFEIEKKIPHFFH